MGYILSIVEKISSARFTSPKNKTVAKATRVFKYDKDHVVVELSQGNYMACRLLGYCGKTAWAPSPRQHWIVDALHAFGVITAEEIAEHKRRVDAEWSEHQKQRDFAWLQGLAERYKFELTPAQMRQFVQDVDTK